MTNEGLCAFVSLKAPHSTADVISVLYAGETLAVHHNKGPVAVRDRPKFIQVKGGLVNCHVFLKNDA